MRLSAFLVAILAWSVSTTAFAVVVFYTDMPSFDGAVSTTLVEDFEAVTPKDTPLPSFVSNGITYTGLAGTPPNVWVASPGYTNFGVPTTTTSILTATGDEDFTLELLMPPATAVGFDTYLNQFGPATVSVFGNGNVLLDTFVHSHDPATVGFLGIVATENIASIRWTTVNGRAINTGIDNIRIAAVPLPPAIWLFATALIGLLGLGKRRKTA